jgi:hypothetical protein
MFRRLVEWTLSLINVSQELDRHRAAIRDLNARNRDLEEAFKLLSQEIRHLRELGAAEREKLLLKIEGIVGDRQPALPKKRRKTLK